MPPWVRWWRTKSSPSTTPFAPPCLPLDEAQLGGDRLHERRLAVLDLEERNRAERRVAVLVDLEVAQDAVLDVRVEQLLGDLRTVGAACPVDCVEQHLGRLGRIGGVRVDGGLAGVRLEVVDEL